MEFNWIKKHASFISSLLIITILIIIRSVAHEYSQIIYLIMFYITLGLAFNMFLGFTNYICFGYSAFIAIGGYAMALSFKWFANTNIHMHPTLIIIVGLMLSILYSIIMAFAVGAIGLRLREAYFAIATIGLAQGIRFLIEGFKVWGGSEGLIISSNIINTYGSRWLALLSIEYADVIIFFTAILSIVITYILLKSATNYALLAIREDEDVAKSFGVNPIKYKLMAFTISAVLVAFLGADKLLKDQAIFPADAFSLTFTLEAIVITLIGGKGTLMGPIIAGILYAFLKYYLITIMPGFQLLLLAPIVIIIVELFPTGIIGWLRLRFKILDKILA
jgi:branched-chain amino acid transport system permease protein